MTPNLDNHRDCGKCGALNRMGATTCAECGAVLGAAVPRRRSRPPARRSHDVEDDDADPSRADRTRAVLKARNRLKGVRGLLVMYAVIYAPFAVFALVYDPTPRGWLVIGIAALAVAGAVLIYRAPVVFTVAIAVVHTGLTTWDLFDRGVRLPINEIIAILLWMAVPVVLKVSRILADDDRATERLSGQFRTDAAPSDARDRAESRRFAETQAANRVWILVILGVVGAGALGLVGYEFVTRPASVAPVEDSLTRWQAALTSGDLAAAEALCTDDYRERWPKVVKILEREGWEGGMEIAAPYEYRSGETFYEIHFDLPRGKMKTIWMAEDGEWRANRVVMSKVRAK